MCHAHQVARIQLQTSEALKLLPQTQEVVSAVRSLDAQLVDISTLYGDYADKFDLAECKLAIVHCAGHHDPTLIETLWRDIIASGRAVTSTGFCPGIHLFSQLHESYNNTQKATLANTTIDRAPTYSFMRIWNSCQQAVCFKSALLETVSIYFCPEVRNIPIGGHSPGQMHGLQTKLVELGQLYSRSERYFPLSYLVQLLEQTGCRLEWDVGFVHQTLLKVGVAITTLFNIYDHLFKAKVTILCTAAIFV